MIRTLLFGLSAVLASAGTLTAAKVEQTFTGVTYLNSVTSANFKSEFPLGTRWTVLVEWDDAVQPDFLSANQSSYKLSKFTLTLQGKSGAWTTSSLADKSKVGLNIYGTSHEMQFTSGWGPGEHSNPAVADLQTFSINVVLSDNTGKALPGLSPVPRSVDYSVWDKDKSHLKFYMSNDGREVIYGSIDGMGVVKLPEISIDRSGGKELKDEKSTIDFGTSGVRKNGDAITLTIRNTGKAALSGLQVGKSGKQKQDFVVSKLSKTSLAAGASTKIQVTFQPKAKGTRRALLKIVSNDADESPFDIKLIGTGK
jgi:Abnormal spindle-like microcephaly-assoc'd, ASPM-SPD-2-Hydin